MLNLDNLYRNRFQIHKVHILNLNLNGDELSQKFEPGIKPGQRYYDAPSGNQANLSSKKVNLAYIQEQKQIVKDQNIQWDSRNSFTCEEYERLSELRQLQLERLHAIKDEVKGIVTFQGANAALDELTEQSVLERINKIKDVVYFEKKENVFQINHCARIINFYNDQFAQSDGVLDADVKQLFLKECGLPLDTNIDQVCQYERKVDQLATKINYLNTHSENYFTFQNYQGAELLGSVIAKIMKLDNIESNYSAIEQLDLADETISQFIKFINTKDIESILNEHEIISSKLNFTDMFKSQNCVILGDVKYTVPRDLYNQCKHFFESNSHKISDKHLEKLTFREDFINGREKSTKNPLIIFLNANITTNEKTVGRAVK
ncbi:MAG: hypothetical protein EP298_06965 [Gammaproteobacteria bacterium]|nr:MAG: hypothetical protein EP298_06965 [Gammaproteobacteria bacterium]UTW42975.1 hypothetical protein KFE69_02205 [bacterium SCSIO 12844]